MLQPAVFYTVDLFEQEARRSVGQVAGGLADRCQRGPDELGEGGVVEARDRQIFGQPQSLGMRHR